MNEGTAYTASDSNVTPFAPTFGSPIINTGGDGAFRNTIIAKGVRDLAYFRAKLPPVTITINPGANIARNPFQTPMTLAGCGIHTGDPATGLAEGFGTTADTITFLNPTTYDTFYFSNGGLAGIGWRKTTDDVTNQANTQIPVGANLIINRKAAGSFIWIPLP